MANPERGEVTVEIGGTSYTLKSTIKAKIAVEAMFSKAEGRKVRWGEIVDEVNKGSAEHARAVFWSTFMEHHPSVTVERAGELSDLLDAEAMNRSLSVTSEAVQAGDPDPADVQELAPRNGRPQKAQGIKRARKAGTGVASSSVLARSA